MSPFDGTGGEDRMVFHQPRRHSGVQRMVEAPRLRHLHLPPKSCARLGVAVQKEEALSRQSRKVLNWWRLSPRSATSNSSGLFTGSKAATSASAPSAGRPMPWALPQTRLAQRTPARWSRRNAPTSPTSAATGAHAPDHVQGPTMFRTKYRIVRDSFPLDSRLSSVRGGARYGSKWDSQTPTPPLKEPRTTSVAMPSG